MTLPLPRIVPVQVDARLRASFDPLGKDGGPREGLMAARDCDRVRAWLTPDAAVMWLALDELAEREGWDLRWTELHRRQEVQDRARDRYETQGGPYTSRPMEGWHPAYRAGDCHVGPLGRTVDYATFRRRVLPLGFTTVVDWTIKDRRTRRLRPRVFGDTETWHWQVDGPWGPVRARLGYTQAALAATLDVGGWDWLLAQRTGPWAAWDGDRVCYALVQAQLQRAGHDCGRIDGLVGARTEAAARVVGLDLAGAPADVATASYGLASSTQLLSGPSAARRAA